MEFSAWLFHVLKHVAATNYAHLTSSINDDGVFEAELVGVVDNQVAMIASITENATESELAAFEQQLDLLQNAVQAQDAEDKENEARIREILNKLTREERMLIERPLPEEMIPDSESDEGVEY
jgi:DNA-directed RNA polymerase specialized sigma24 family protein